MPIVCQPVNIGYKKCRMPIRMDIEIVLGYGAYHKRPGLLNKLIRFETFHTALQYLSLHWRVFRIWEWVEIFLIKKHYFSATKDFPPLIIFQEVMMICLLIKQPTKKIRQ